MADIFISYASPDRERASTVAERLSERGHSVWWDRTIPPGRVFDEVIQEALQAAKCVVVLWSAESVKSNWVKTEASEAVGQNKLVPALIEPVLPPIEFKRIQAADLSNWSGDGNHPEYQKLVSAVERLLQHPPSAAPRPRPQAAAPAAKAGAGSKLSVLKIMALVGAIGLVAAAGMRWMAHRAQTAPPAATEQQSAPPQESTGSAPAPAAPTEPAAPATSGNTARTPAPSGRTNLLSPAEGGEIVTAPNERWNMVIDGKEETYAWVDAGEAVFAFKGGRAATFDAFAILIPGASDNNLREFELLVANDLGGPFESLGVFTTQNTRIMKNPYQEFRFTAVKAKYLKVRAMKSHGGSDVSTGHEFQLFGRLD
jgi:hypothetical protein